MYHLGSAQCNSSIAAGGGLGAAPRPRGRLAQRLDLRCSLCAAIGHDLLKHTHAILKLVRSRGILSRFLRSHPSFYLESLLAQSEIAVGDQHQRQDGQADDDQRDHDLSWPNHALPPLSIASASISLTSLDGWSVTMRSTVSIRSLSEPSSARSCAFSWVSSLIRSSDSWSLFG